MKTLRIIVISLLIIFVSIASAQDFRLGFRLESNSVIVKETETNKTKLIVNAPTGLYVSLAYSPIKELGFEFNIGGDLDAAYFTGNGAGLFARYLFSDPVYATGGIVVHDIFNNSNKSIHAYTNSFVVFPALGLGTNLNEYLGIDLTFLYGNIFKAGYTKHIVDEKTGAFRPYPVELNWVTKLGVSYSFGL